MLGDYVVEKVVGGKQVPIELITEQLSKLKAKNGVVAILGNHDWEYGVGKILKAFKETEIILLSNEVKGIETGQCILHIAGLDDLWNGDNNYLDVISKMKGLSNKLVLSHNPDVIRNEKFLDNTLLLAGHTHGGQFNLPLFGSFFTPSVYGDKYNNGVYKFENGTMFVTSGIGTSVVGLRLSATPEIALIKIR